MRYEQTDDISRLDLTVGQSRGNKIMWIFTKVRKYLTKIIFQCKCVSNSFKKDQVSRICAMFMEGGEWTLLHCCILQKFWGYM